MSSRVLTSMAGALIVVVSISSCVAAQPEPTKAQTAQVQAVSLPSYPETPEELKSLLADLFAAETSGAMAKAPALYESLVIPDHAQWFAKTFGEAEGGRLETKYLSTREEAAARLKKSVENVVRQHRTFVGVQVFQKPGDTSIVLAKPVLTSMIIPTTIYDAGVSTGPDDKSPFFFGYFVYLNGGFRYLDLDVLRALSTAPPIRMRIGGAVQAAKLVSKVDPIYPADVRIQGTVKLHVIIAADGSIEQIQVISGHPMLIPATLDAVKQWRYQPTLLNGQPVEVDTEVNVVFQLPN